jgi:hypothetical protein
VSILAKVSFQSPFNGHFVSLEGHLRLAFEVLHNIKESIVDIGLVGKLNFDLIKITEGILWQIN